MADGIDSAPARRPRDFRLHRRVHRDVHTRLVRHFGGVAVQRSLASAGLAHRSLHRLVRDRPRARVRAVLPDPDPRAGVRGALQPGGHRGPDRDPRDQADRRRDLHRGPACRRHAGRAVHEGSCSTTTPMRMRSTSVRSAISDRIGGEVFWGGVSVELIGTFFLVWAIVGVAVNPRSDRGWAALVIGGTLGMLVMVAGPLTGAGFNPARAFGPALVSGEWGGADDFIITYVLAPVVGGVLGALVYFRMVIVPGKKGRAGWSRSADARPAGVISAALSRRRVTFSRNFTLSLSRTCRCYCKYCAFATHRAHLYAPDEVERLLDDAVRRNAKELLILTGERPEVNAEVAARLDGYGHADFTSYVAWACERALERGLLPHTNIGAIERDDLARLREVTASQGLMLESIEPGPRRSPGLADEAPGRPPGHDPRRRRTEDPLHERNPGRNRRDARGAHTCARSARRGARRIRPPPRGDPPELRPTPPLLRRRARGNSRRSTEQPGNEQRATGNDGPAPLGHANHAGRHEAARPRGPAPDARRRHPNPARTSPTGGSRWSKRARPTSAGCPRTATTSRRSTRSRRRTGCASCSSRRARR